MNRKNGEREMKSCCCLILNYNDSETTAKQVNEVAGYSCFDHILLVDNCSSDHSWDVLSKQANVIAIRAERNGGYGAGNNFGIRYAKETLGCDYVLVCNPDVVYSQQLVERLIAVMESDPTNAIVSAVQLDIHGNVIQDKAWKLPDSSRYALTFLHSGMQKADLYYSKEYFETNSVVEVDCVPGAMLLVDAEKFLAIGGYDEEMFLYCEEDTIAFKIKCAGLRTLLVQDQSYLHQHGVM